MSNLLFNEVIIFDRHARPAVPLFSRNINSIKKGPLESEEFSNFKEVHFKFYKLDHINLKGNAQNRTNLNSQKNI